MDEIEVQSALSAAKSVASALGLRAEEGDVLQNSNRLAVRLLPADVLVRVARLGLQESLQFEVDVARDLTGHGSPVARLAPGVEPRAHVSGNFAITFWTYYQPVFDIPIAPAHYARALEGLHLGMRQSTLTTRHFTHRIAWALRIIDNPDLSPALVEPDRRLVSSALRTLRASIAKHGAAEQLLHAEPHPGNLLQTIDGPLFIDLETCCRGPVEFDVAHAPEEVAEHYPGLDRGLLGECRTLILALVAAWRWDKDDQFPDGLTMGRELVSQLRAAARQYGFDTGDDS